MEILYPMIISAVAVLATLIYASYLDIRDRRVPFIHWLPMLVTGSYLYRIPPVAENCKPQSDLRLPLTCRKFSLCGLS